MDELELVRRCAAGDNDAWSGFLDQYGRFLRFVIRRAATGLHGHEVDDLHDEIVAWLFERDGKILQSFRGESKLSSWLGVVVARRVKRLIARRIRDEGGTVSIDALSHDAGAELADDGRRDTGFRAPAIDALRDALDALPERDRKLLTACFLQKRRYDEIAEEIGVRENSIGQLLHRAKKKLRKRLGGEKFLETLSGSILALLSLFGPGSGPSP